MVMPKAYEGNEPYIFISYAHKDSDKVIPIIQALQDRGFRVWYDEGLEVGSSWSDMIEEYLFKCACTICFISPNFLNSQNCQDEIDYAKEIKKSPLIVYLEDMLPNRKFQFRYGRLHKLKYTDFSSLNVFMDKLESTEALLPCRSNSPAPALLPDLNRFDCPNAEECFRKGKKRYFSNLRNTPETAQLFLEAAQQGHAESQFYYAICLANGYGLEKNDREAFVWYQKSADLQNANAQNNLAYCYYHGIGTDMDKHAAFRWYCTAAENGHIGARGMVGFCLETGTGTPPNLEEAVKHYRAAALQGNAYAQANLGACYAIGKGVLQDWKEAARLFASAAQQGHAGAQRHLGTCYEHGRGVDRDLLEAEKWYQKAVDQGDQTAKELLTKLMSRIDKPTDQFDKPYIYTSFSHADTGRVLPIIRLLQQKGFRVWFDNGIDVGSTWEDDTAEKIENCSCVLTFISQNYQKSGNCRGELSYALGLKKTILNIHLEHFQLSTGMQFQVSRQQSLFRYRHPNDESFVDRLVQMQTLSVCRE